MSNVYETVEDATTQHREIICHTMNGMTGPMYGKYDILKLIYSEQAAISERNSARAYSKIKTQIEVRLTRTWYLTGEEIREVADALGDIDEIINAALGQGATFEEMRKFVHHKIKAKING
jgi:hypothetical protein